MLQVGHRTHSSPKQALRGKFPADRRQKHAEMQRFPKRHRANCSTSACHLQHPVPHPTPLHAVFLLSPGGISVFIRSLSFVKAAAMRSETGITTAEREEPSGDLPWIQPAPEFVISARQGRGCGHPGPRVHDVELFRNETEQQFARSRPASPAGICRPPRRSPRSPPGSQNPENGKFPRKENNGENFGCFFVLFF